ncbi:MAG TPA: glycoside hydrolase family 38 C-terminal domain-containing protein, partial [Ktedonobacterales bacterium]|nr:glycoside hydrolase family 38 C-terminal domain-containing protein [Ktedonobacterales bacterium]
MPETTRLLIVPHTHWDREWYQTFEQFRMRLVHAVDAVLDVLESDPGFTYFMLDGQTIVLEDYLEVRPEQAERLRRLTRAGRLLVGPWYLQPDEFLVGGESLIRNLHEGTRSAEEYGGAMPVGYVPDIFGHIAQLPQILRGFGLDNAVFWRGVGPEVERSEFHWAAPDGTTVLVAWLCDAWGYSNARSLPLDAAGLLDRTERIVPPLLRRATTNTLLLMNGSDHLEPQAGLPQAIAAANEQLKDAGEELVIGTLPQYLAAIKQANPPLATYTGEMRGSRYAHLLPGVLSTRMWIKQRNAAVEALLTRWAEPASTWAWRLGAAYPAGFLRVAWRHLLRNHPHDSICGCSIDQVHAEMRSRFDQSEQIAEALTQQALAHIASQIDTRAPAAGDDAHAVVVFNAGPGPRTDAVAAELELPVADIEVLDDSGQPVPHRVRQVSHHELLAQDVPLDFVPRMLDQVHQGHIEGYVIVDAHVTPEADGAIERVEVIVATQGKPNLPAFEAASARIAAAIQRGRVTSFRLRVRLVARVEVELLATGVPAFGARAYFVRPASRTRERMPAGGMLTAGPDSIANEFYQVNVERATGALTVLDKTTGVRYAGLNQFQDGGDVGDLYNYSPPAYDQLVTQPRQTPASELVAAGPVRATLRISGDYALPARCADDRQSRLSETVGCAIVSEVTLTPGGRRIDIRTTVDNRACDHRLRVLFPTPIATEFSEAEGAFQVVRRPLRLAPPAPGEPPWSEWAELPVATHPQKRFIDVSDGSSGLAVINRGLPEYEVMRAPEDGGVTIALTLLRGVEWLS